MQKVKFFNKSEQIFNNTTTTEQSSKKNIFFDDSDIESDDDDEDECQHAIKTNIKGQDTCMDCGKVFLSLSKEQEWRYYGNEDTRYSSNPSRCHISKQEKHDKTIIGDIAMYNFPDIIKSKADEIYQHHLNESSKKIYRNDSRKGIILACLSLACEISGHPRNPDILCKLLNIKKKQASCGKKEIERTCFKKYIYPTLNYGNTTIFKLIPEFLTSIDFVEKDALLDSIRDTISTCYWNLDTLKMGLDCKDIDYPPNITKANAKYMIEYYFTNIYNPQTTIPHPQDPFPKIQDYKLRESKLLKRSFKQSIAVGILYYNLIKDGWIGFSFQKSIIYWFNTNNPYFCNENGKLYIEKKIAIWIPNLPHVNYIQMLSKIQFICKSDINQFIGQDLNIDPSLLLDNYGTCYIISKKEFAQLVGFSDITIMKITCEIDHIRKTSLLPKKKHEICDIPLTVEEKKLKKLQKKLKREAELVNKKNKKIKKVKKVVIPKKLHKKLDALITAKLASINPEFKPIFIKIPFGFKNSFNMEEEEEEEEEDDSDDDACDEDDCDEDAFDEDAFDDDACDI